MIFVLITGVLLGLNPPAQDTVVNLSTGDRLILEGLSGAVSVEAWDRDNLELRSRSREDVRFGVRRSGSRLEVVPLGRRGGHEEVELRLRVPPWISLDISGRDLDVDVRGLTGEVSLRNLDGDLSLADLSGSVEAISVQGSIEAQEIHGTVRLRTGDDDVEVDGASGDLRIETISGDLELRNMAPIRLEIGPTSGDVEFQGTLSPAGDYLLRSHDGDLTLTLMEPPDLVVSVLVYDGEFRSDFPVRTRGFRSGQDFSFALGDGGGQLRLETFDGDIRLLRGG